MISRRNLLRNLGLGSLALPFLPSMRSHAQPSARPLRLVVVYHTIGTLVDRWTPGGTGSGYTMSDLLRPLEAHRDDMLVLSGIENRLVNRLTSGEIGHAEAARMLFTGAPLEGQIVDGVPVRLEDADFRSPIGASIDQIVADRIAAPAGEGVRSVHLSVGGSYPGEYSAFWRDRGDRVEWIANDPDPNDVVSRFFSGVMPDEPRPLTFQERLRSSDVLAGVQQTYSRLGQSLPVDDRNTLEAHSRLLDELRENLSVGVDIGGACQIPSLSTPGGEYWFDRVENALASANAQTDIIPLLLACDLTRVVTLQFTHSHGQRFLDIPDYTVPGFGYSDWHAMVHNDDGASLGDSLYLGYEWYSHRMERLISRLKSIPEGDGTLLDNTIVLWMSEFGDGGGHDVRDLPVVLFGGPIRKGEHLDMRGRTNQELMIGLAERFGLSLPTVGMGEFGGESFVENPISLT